MLLLRLAIVCLLVQCGCALPSYSSVDGGAGQTGAATGAGGGGGAETGGAGGGPQGGMGGQGGEARDDWYDARYPYRKPLVLDTQGVLTDLTDFPVPIVIPLDDDLRDVAHASGRDIVFTAADGVTKLDHEIEDFSPVNGALVAWVRVPLIVQQTDTQLYMFYGDPDSADQQNAEGTWPISMYRGVWHLSDNPMSSAPQIHDSTSFAVDGEVGSGNAVPSSEQGVAGRALRFDGAALEGDRVTMDDLADDHLNPAGDSFSYSLWLKLPTILSGGGRALDKFQIAPNRGYRLSGSAGAFAAQVYANDTQKTANVGMIPANVWTHVAVVLNRDAHKLSAYRDGVFHDDDDIADLMAVANNQPLSLSPGGDSFGGIIDEVRFYGVPLSDAWIALERRALANQGFLQVGPAEPY